MTSFEFTAQGMPMALSIVLITVGLLFLALSIAGIGIVLKTNSGKLAVTTIGFMVLSVVVLIGGSVTNSNMQYDQIRSAFHQHGYIIADHNFDMDKSFHVFTSDNQKAITVILYSEGNSKYRAMEVTK